MTAKDDQSLMHETDDRQKPLRLNPKAHTGRYKVLVVEADTVDQLAFKRLVEQDGLPYDYTIAESVAEAREFLSRDWCEIVIADYMLGDGTAFDLMDATQDIPMIIATGTGDEEIAVQAMKKGAYDYLIKDPMRNYLKMLPMTVEHALQRKWAADRHRMMSHAIMSISDSVVITDDDDYIILTNRAFCNTYGYREDDILGQSIDCLWTDETIYHPSHGTSPRQKEVDGEFISRRKDGSLLTISLSRSLITDDNGTTLACLSIIRDITERKQAEDNLRTSKEEVQQYAAYLEKRNRELDQFSYVISHDLKAPLRAIANLARWIEEDLGDSLPGESREHMNLLNKRVLRMNALIEGLLQYSRNGRLQETFTTVREDDLLKEVIDSLAPPAGFEVVIQPGMPQLFTSPLQLTQVFTNLISNALTRHDKKRGRVEITVEELDHTYRFSVIDDGPGIDPAYHNKVFEIFQTLQPPDRVESTGIGLALVKKIVEDNNCEIELHSKEGAGTIFRFTWPKDSRKENNVGEQTDQSSSGGGWRSGYFGYPTVHANAQGSQSSLYSQRWHRGTGHAPGHWRGWRSGGPLSIPRPAGSQSAQDGRTGVFEGRTQRSEITSHHDYYHHQFGRQTDPGGGFRFECVQLSLQAGELRSTACDDRHTGTVMESSCR